MGRIVRRTLTVLVLIAAVVAVANDHLYVGVLMLMIAAAAPIGAWIAREDADRAEQGSDYTTPPAGLDGRSWGGGG